MTSRGTGPGGGKDDGASAQETARYIADMSNGVSAIARKAGLEVLAYLLDMVRIEAEETAQKDKTPRDRPEGPDSIRRVT